MSSPVLQKLFWLPKALVWGTVDMCLRNQLGPHGVGEPDHPSISIRLAYLHQAQRFPLNGSASHACLGGFSAGTTDMLAMSDGFAGNGTQPKQYSTSLERACCAWKMRPCSACLPGPIAASNPCSPVSAETAIDREKAVTWPSWGLSAPHATS